MANLLDFFPSIDADKELTTFAELAGWKPVYANEKFLANFQETMRLENPARPTKPGFIRPSSLTECLRKLVYEYQAVPEESGYDGTPRIAESGTDAHKRIQGYIMAMKGHGYEVEYISVKDYLDLFPNPDLEIIDETINHTIVSVDVKSDTIVYLDGDKSKTKALSWYVDRYNSAETLVYNKRTKSRFKADGIVKFNGEYYILEIKTENAKKYGSHNKTLEPHDKHKLQGTFYGISFKIDKVMFLYENRDSCATFVTIFEITKQFKNKVMNLIDETIKYGDGGWVAPRTISKDECRYCPYRIRCDGAGETLPQ